MQRLEVSCAVLRIYMSLGAKGLKGGKFLDLLSGYQPRKKGVLREVTYF